MRCCLFSETFWLEISKGNEKNRKAFTKNEHQGTDSRAFLFKALIWGDYGGINKFMKRIAAITMVRNDKFFLHKWVEYYGKHLGKENLFIFFDGLDQEIPDFCQDIYSEKVDKIGSNVVSSDKGRIKFISGQADLLFKKGYDIIIGGDADEYLVVDPKLNVPLKEFLSSLRFKNCVSGLGLDFGQMLGQEYDLTLSKPFLQQRRFAQISTRYTKATVINTPSEWGSGFHRVKGRNFHIIPGLYLMHFGYSDLKIIEERFGDKDKIKQGWSRHINKRRRVIRFVNSLPIRKFETTVKMARKIERVFRPPYAWNKPGLLGLRLMVELPERFENSL